jgi:hypothetical protein
MGDKHIPRANSDLRQDVGTPLLHFMVKVVQHGMM